jgi:Sel1 repeat
MLMKFFRWSALPVLILCAMQGIAFAPAAPLTDAGRDAVKAKDYEAAMVKFEEACLNGEADGCSAKGVLFDQGWGVEKDAARAHILFVKACDAGSAKGCKNLGGSYYSGRGIDKDFLKAFAAYTKSCDGGDLGGCENLGIMYENGEGTTQDKAKAQMFYTKACDGKVATACKNAADSLIAVGPPAQTQQQQLSGDALATLDMCTYVYMYLSDGSGPEFEAILTKLQNATGMDRATMIAHTRSSVERLVNAIAIGKLSDLEQETIAECAVTSGVAPPAAPPLAVILSADEANTASKVELAWETSVGCAADYYSQGGYDDAQGSPSPQFEAMIARVRYLDPSYSQTRAIAIARALATIRNKELGISQYYRYRSPQNLAWSRQCEYFFGVPAPMSYAEATRMDADFQIHKEKFRSPSDKERQASSGGSYMGNDADYADIDSDLQACQNVESRDEVPAAMLSRWFEITTRCRQIRSDAISIAQRNGDTGRAAAYRNINFGW